MREKELYRDTLEHIRDRNEKLYGGKLVMTRAEAAKLVGVSVRTLTQEFVGEQYLTCEKLARWLS